MPYSLPVEPTQSDLDFIDDDESIVHVSDAEAFIDSEVVSVGVGQAGEGESGEGNMSGVKIRSNIGSAVSSVLIYFTLCASTLIAFFR